MDEDQSLRSSFSPSRDLEPIYPSTKTGLRRSETEQSLESPVQPSISLCRLPELQFTKSRLRQQAVIDEKKTKLAALYSIILHGS